MMLYTVVEGCVGPTFCFAQGFCASNPCVQPQSPQNFVFLGDLVQIHCTQPFQKAFGLFWAVYNKFCHGQGGELLQEAPHLYTKVFVCFTLMQKGKIHIN